MAWDPTSQTILLFGGDTNAGASNAFDAWDGTSWVKLGRPGGPPARDDGRLVADPGRGVVVLSGGRDGQRILNDTWEWDGTAWTEKTLEGPTPRAHAASAYDPVSKRVLVYGGVNETDTLRDTWAWDGASWTQLEKVGIPGRIPNGMAWDPTRKQLLILAVNLDHPNADKTYPTELWGWTGSAWELVAGDGPAFSPLQQFVEGPRHPFIIDGGVVQNQFAAHEWSGTAWTTIPGATPPIRNGQAAAWDPVCEELVMFGGFVGNTVFGDTWTAPPTGPWRLVGPS